MKKYLFIAAAAIAVLSGCTKENEYVKKGLVFTASMECVDTRANFDATDKCVSWEVGDQIAIIAIAGEDDVSLANYRAKTAGTSTTFEASTEGDELEAAEYYKAFFPASLYYDLTKGPVMPAEISETWVDGLFNMPMYAESPTTVLSFKNLCGVLKITVNSGQLASVKKIRVSSSNKGISGEFTLPLEGELSVVLNEEYADFPSDNTVTVTYTDAVTTEATGKSFFVAIPPQTYRDLKIEIDPDGKGFTKSMTTKSGVDIVVDRNKIYSITFADSIPAAVPDGALPGKFSVSTDKQVYFSKGNLMAWYNSYSYEWRFPGNQNDRVGMAGGSNIESPRQGSTVDLFGWSTSTTNYGISLSFNSDEYMGDFVDWGKNIGDGNTWRTLTVDEWSYLLGSSSERNGKYHYGVTVRGTVNCLVIAPDDFEGSIVSSYDETSWDEAQAYGLVCLPPAGLREGYYVNSDLAIGCYWSSSKAGEDSAYCVEFGTNYLYSPKTSSRYQGTAVRLVTDVK